MSDLRARVGVPAWVLALGAAAVGALIVVVVLAVTGDSDADDEAATTSSTSSTSAPTSTEGTSPSSSTTAPDDAAERDFPTYSNDGPSGAGCSPGTGDLPDGWWFGALPDGGVSGPITDFDLACFFVGDAAARAAAEDGHPTALDEGFVENDYWIRNESATIRPVAVSAAVEAFCVLLDPQDATRPLPCARGEVGQMFDVWLRVRGGQVDRIVEQFVP